MALDHFVSQVHLKRFYSPILGNRLYAIRKSTLKRFTPPARNICRIEEGSSNSYLLKARAIEDFLKTIENKYNESVESLVTGKINTECIYALAGFVAYVSSCSPTAMRLGEDSLRETVASTGTILEANGALPPAPAELGSTSFTELIRTGKLKIDVDPKYSQAMGIASIYGRIAHFGNFKWEILINEHCDIEFFTSDFPAAMEQSANPLVFNRVVPLTPTVAIRIWPDIRLERERLDFSFRHFGWRKRSVSRKEIVDINRLLVRCAEDEVYHRTDYAWVEPFISKNRNYHLESYTTKFPSIKGQLLAFSHRIVKREDV